MRASIHSKNFQYLKNLFENSKMPHALLFTGPKGNGKQLFTQHWVQWLFCLEQEKPCQNCKNCNRIEKELHPDVFFVKPEKGTIKIDAIRGLKENLSLKPLESAFKVIVFEEVELLNLAAANALLKTLEEPPANTFFILLSSSPYKLLKTILSRCQKIFFPPLTEEERKQLEKEEDQEEEQAQTWVNNTLLPALDAQPKDIIKLFEVAEELASEEKLRKKILEILLKQWHERLRKTPTLSELGKFNSISQALQKLDLHANALLTLENLFLGLCL